MIPRRKHPAASLPKTRNALTIRNRQPVTRIDSKQPKLIEVCGIERT